MPEFEDDLSEPRVSVTLVVQGGTTDGSSASLHKGQSVTIGSGRLANLRIDSPDVGGVHARVSWDELGLSISDNGSATGTYVNGEPVMMGPLADGDRISFVAPGAKTSAPTVLVQGGEARGTAPPQTYGSPAAAQAARVDAKPKFLPKAVTTPTRPEPMKLRLPSIDWAALLRPPALYAVAGTGGLLGLTLLVWLAFLFFGGKPVVTGVTPPRAAPGQQVEIAGKNFAADAAKNTVRFGDAAGAVVAVAPDGLTVTVPTPAQGTSREAVVTVETPKGRSNAIAFRFDPAPAITMLEPDVAEPGNDVVLKADFADDAQLAITVALKTAEIIEVRPGAIRFRVPPLDQRKGMAVQVVLKAGQLTSKPAALLVGQPPLISSVEPSTGLPGDRVRLNGGGFASEAFANNVTFFGVPALVVTAARNQLEVVVPGVAASGIQGDVRVQVVDRISDPAGFTITRPSSNQFFLRFFGAPGGQAGQALVATDVGPAFLLTGQGAGDRAARAAAALNRLVDDMRAGRAVSLEVRPGQPPALAAAGAREPVVTVTPEDAASYAVPKGGAPSPESLAQLWLAIVDDYLTLFERKERPLRLAALSPKARTWVDLAQTLGWRAGEPVSRGAVDALPDATKGHMRDMVLAAPEGGGAAPSSGTPLDGTWEGTFDDGSGNRNASLKITKAGKAYTGSLAVRMQGIDLDVKLKDITYAGGTLTFVAPIGGVARTFTGRVDGGKLSGTIHKGPATSPPTGRFDLHLVS